ncbi:MAG: hypothetical protein NT126_07530 [Bacteroidetes bacterium]|nr:hypothetical protein [Bacteroidota bacterium]
MKKNTIRWLLVSMLLIILVVLADILVDKHNRKAMNARKEKSEFENPR